MNEIADIKWTPGELRVLGEVANNGGWYATKHSPSTTAMRSVERKLGVSFQREHGLHEPPYYYPMHNIDHDTIVTALRSTQP